MADPDVEAVPEEELFADPVVEADPEEDPEDLLAFEEVELVSVEAVDPEDVVSFEDPCEPDELLELVPFFNSF